MPFDPDLEYVTRDTGRELSHKIVRSNALSLTAPIKGGSLTPFARDRRPVPKGRPLGPERRTSKRGGRSPVRSGNALLRNSPRTIT